MLLHDLAALPDLSSAGEADAATFNGLVDCTRYALRLRYTPAPASARMTGPGASNG